MYKEITCCRLCSGEVRDVFSFGDIALTGVFPAPNEEHPPKAPLGIVECQSCKLIQLRQSYYTHLMYGMNYGYRSGLNKMMVDHLAKVRELAISLANPQMGDKVLDIGSNDGTLVNGYSTNLDVFAIDPTIKKFRKYYQNHVTPIDAFFSADLLNGKKMKIVTALSMLYDLEDPQKFVNEVASILDDSGVFITEQGYGVHMMKTGEFETICHEHLEYYGLKQIKLMADRAKLVIVHAELTETNGVSILVIMQKSGKESPEVQRIIDSEVYDCGKFRENVMNKTIEIAVGVEKLKDSNKLILGYGASTKGNVILQQCKLRFPCIADVNEDKHDKLTPGTGIPIVSEDLAKKAKPDYFFVLPYHFRDGIIRREMEFLEEGGRLIFPLPKFEVVGVPITVLIPTKWRPSKLERCIKSIPKWVNVALLATVPDDIPEKIRFDKSGRFFIHYDANMSVCQAFNYLANNSIGDVVMGSDDIEFYEGCFEAARKLMDKKRHDAVVGFHITNIHANVDAIAMVGSRYRRGKDKIWCEEYQHFFIDTELGDEARAQGKFFYCDEAKLLNYHPVSGCAPDATHKDRRNEKFIHDEAVYQRRQKKIALIPQEKDI